MISIFRRLTFIFLISQLTTISAYGQSDIQNRAQSALAEARSLNEKPVLKGLVGLLQKNTCWQLKSLQAISYTQMR